MACSSPLPLSSSSSSSACDMTASSSASSRRPRRQHRTRIASSRSSRAAVAGTAALLASRVAAVDVTVSSKIETCGQMTVTWDTTGGTAPWTVTIAPINQIPASYSLPDSYMTSSSSSGSKGTYVWDVPNYSAPPQLIVAVSDSTGRVTGTSSLQKMTVGTGSCSAPDDSLDFVWFPPDKSPKSCSEWTLTWQEDTGNHGIVKPVQFALLPEKGTPLYYVAPSADTDWKMPVEWSAGTKFTVAAFDAGKAGNGGVGDVYTVAKNKGTCTNSDAMPTIGLVAATNVVSSAPTATSSTAGGSTKSSKSAATPTAKTSDAAGSTGTSSTNNDASSGSSNNSSGHGGAIAGGIVGSLAAVAALVGFFLLWKRRKSSTPDQPEKKSRWGGAEVMPWRWEVVDDEKEPEYPVAAAHNRRRSSQDQPAFPPPAHAHASASGASPTSRHVSNHSLSSRNVYSVVPDNALFPPPSPQQQQQRMGQQQNLERPAKARVVPDSMLFPPPDPNANVANVTNVAGKGAAFAGAAGVGVPAKASSPPQRQQRQLPTSSPPQRPARPDESSSAQTSPANQARKVAQASQQERRQERRPEPAALEPLALSHSVRNEPPLPSPRTQQHNADEAALNRSPLGYVPPPGPVSTSIHDPYAHMSQFYNDPAMQARIAAMGASMPMAPSVPSIPSQYYGHQQQPSQGFEGHTPRTHAPYPYQRQPSYPQTPNSTASAASQHPLPSQHARGMSGGTSRLPPSIYPGSRGLADEPVQQGQGQGQAQPYPFASGTAAQRDDDRDADEGGLPYL